MACIDKHSLTLWKEFILMGITGLAKLQVPLVGPDLTVCLISVVGILSLIIRTKMDSVLQTPMYFFLRFLAFHSYLSYSTTMAPKMFSKCYWGNKYNLLFLHHMGAFHTIYVHCFELFILSAVLWSLLWTSVTLHSTLTSWRKGCVRCCGNPRSLWHICFSSSHHKIFNLSYCGSNIVSHFYCDNLPLLSSFCSNTDKIELTIMILF